MIGMINDVASYAPEGYKLTASQYEDGGVTHVFTRLDGLVVALCHVSQHEDERDVLAAFRSQSELERTAGLFATTADTEPAPALKPPRRKSR